MGCKQPLLIYKTKSGKDVETRTFRTSTEALKWLRSEGCRFRNDALSDIRDYRVTMATDDYEYEIEAFPLRSVKRTRVE